jgi:colanic acid/amylovoran biosynthesis glycosyltransferase
VDCPTLPLRVFAGEYPLSSETFITTQAIGLARRGWTIEMVTRRRLPETDPARPTPFPIRDLGAGWRRIPLVATAISALRLAAVGRFTTLGRTLDPMRHGKRALKGHLPVLADAAAVLCPGPSVWLCHYGHNGELLTRLRDSGAVTGPIATVFHGFDVAKRLTDPTPPYRLLAARGDLFLPVSALWRETLLRWGFPADRTVVCPLGIDCGESPVRTTAAALRILSVCRLVEKKGVAYALRGIAALEPGLRVGVRYRIAGDGPLRSQLEALASELGIAGQVDFLGTVPHSRVPDLLRESDVFLLPSITAANGDMEGVPISLIEAMASGLPVVSTRHSGIPELISHGHDGLLVDERDHEAIAASLTRLAKDIDLRQRLGASARATAIERRSLDSCTDRLHALLSALGRSLIAPA